MEREHGTYQEFFRRTGNNWLHPKSYGEAIWPVTVEEMYQHFKARMLDEMREQCARDD